LNTDKDTVPTVAEVFALALHHCTAGNLRQAEQVCRHILQADPGNADTHHLLAVLAQSQGRLDEAVAHFQQALRFRPDFAEAHNNLGNTMFLKGNLDDATAHYRQALRLRPDYVEAHNNLGLALAGNGQRDEAIHHYQQALRLNPNSAEAHNNLGGALVDQGKPAEAIVCLQQALRLKPDYAKAHHNLGVALAGQDRLDEAICSYQQALRFQPESAETYCSWGAALEQQGNLDEAIRCYRQALKFKPCCAEALNNLGLALERQNKMDEAIACYKQVLQFKPDSVVAYTNLGNIHWDQGHFDEAMACYEQALTCDPKSAQTHFNRARLRLLNGDWAQGWPEYEWRWQTKECSVWSFPQPRWDGSPLAGRTILLLAEQGLGDTVHFIRYAPLVKQQGGTVIVECQPALMRLLANAAGIDLLVARGWPLPAFDTHASLLSLPALLHTTIATVPAAVPYLLADMELAEYWQRKLSDVGCAMSGVGSMSEFRGPKSGVGRIGFDIGHRTSDIGRGFRIGISWQGNPAFIGDRKRSIELAHFAPLAQVPSVQLISLQKGPGTEQVAKLGARFPVLDLSERLDETAGAFMDSAAVMETLDLVITSDTAIAHLAGALGIPVWVALCWVPDYRWMLQREDSPWYPTMRLFRQTRRGHWDDVFDLLAAELRKRATYGRLS
jgi:tetratricopeptide (TPR) repeat protein